MIKKIGNKYKVLSEKTKRNMGTYNKKSDAVRRLRQIEFFKHKNLKKDKKGLAAELVILIVVAFVSILFFVGWQYAFHLITGQMQNIQGITMNQNNGSSVDLNFSQAATSTFGNVDNGLINGLPIISFSIIFGFIIATILLAWGSKTHPIMLPIYVLFVIGVIIFSIYISNTYQSLQANPILSSTMQNYSMANYFMNNLPYFIAVIGLLGIVFSLINVIKGRDYE